MTQRRRRASIARPASEKRTIINRAMEDVTALVALAEANALVLRQAGDAARSPGGMGPGNSGDISTAIASALQIVKAQR